MIEENTIITLGENHRYLVAFSTIYNNINYVFLTNIDNVLDTYFYEYKGNDNLSLVKDEKLIEELLNIYKKEKILD